MQQEEVGRDLLEVLRRVSEYGAGEGLEDATLGEIMQREDAPRAEIQYLLDVVGHIAAATALPAVVVGEGGGAVEGEGGGAVEGGGGGGVDDGDDDNDDDDDDARVAFDAKFARLIDALPEFIQGDFAKNADQFDGEAPFMKAHYYRAILNNELREGDDRPVVRELARHISTGRVGAYTIRAVEPPTGEMVLELVPDARENEGGGEPGADAPMRHRTMMPVLRRVAKPFDREQWFDRFVVNEGVLYHTTLTLPERALAAIETMEAAVRVANVSTLMFAWLGIHGGLPTLMVRYHFLTTTSLMLDSASRFAVYKPLCATCADVGPCCRQKVGRLEKVECDALVVALQAAMQDIVSVLLLDAGSPVFSRVNFDVSKCYGAKMFEMDGDHFLRHVVYTSLITCTHVRRAVNGVAVEGLMYET